MTKQEFSKFLELNNELKATNIKRERTEEDLQIEFENLKSNSEFFKLCQKYSENLKVIDNKMFEKYIADLHIIVSGILGLKKTQVINMDIMGGEKGRKKSVSLRNNGFYSREQYQTNKRKIEQWDYSLIIDDEVKDALIKRCYEEEQRNKINKIYGFLKFKLKYEEYNSFGEFKISDKNLFKNLELNYEVYNGDFITSKNITEIKFKLSDDITLDIIYSKNYGTGSETFYPNYNLTKTPAFLDILVNFEQDFINCLKETTAKLEEKFKEIKDLKEQVDEIYKPYLTLANL